MELIYVPGKTLNKPQEGSTVVLVKELIMNLRQVSFKRALGYTRLGASGSQASKNNSIVFLIFRKNLAK